MKALLAALLLVAAQARAAEDAAIPPETKVAVTLLPLCVTFTTPPSSKFHIPLRSSVFFCPT